MGKVKVAAFAVSLDGFGAGPNQRLENPMGRDENPPYHVPVYVLTHHKREPLVMEGGTTFHFVTDGIESALQKARASANGKDIRIGGGVQVVRDYLRAGLIDELHLVHSPVYLGSGESLYAGLEIPKLGFSIIEKAETPDATHLILNKSI